MKRYGEKTLREALENGAVLSIYDCPARGPILRVKKDDKNLGWITFDLYLKIRLDLEVVKKGEYSKEYTLKSIVYADIRKGLTPETETTAPVQQEGTTDRSASATGRRFYDTGHGVCLTDYDLLEEWENDPGLRQEYPRFSWYVAACQTYQGGTLEEIRE